MNPEVRPVRSLAASLATALATPALLMPVAAGAQQTSDSGGSVSQLAPVQVQGTAPQSYETPDASQTKFTAPLVDTPKSVQVIPQAVIQDTAATSLQDILRNSPGITFGAGEGGQPLADRPFIRGNASANNIFVDGIRDPGGQTREIFNLESVEVIKGADSAYGGQGSGGGSINMVSKQAKLGDFAEGTFSLGTDAYLRATADGNWQFNDTSAFRLNLMGTKGNVPGRNVVDFNRWGVAPSLSFGLGTPTRVTLSYYHMQTDDMPDYGVPLARKTGETTSDGLLDIGRDKFYGLLDRDFRKTKSDIGTLRIEHDFNDNITFRNSTRYGQTLNDYVVTNPGDGGMAVFDPVTNQWWMRRSVFNADKGVYVPIVKSRWNQTTMLSNVSELYGEFKTGSIGHSYDVGIELTRERNKNASYDVESTGGSFCPAVLGGFDCTPLYHPDPHDPWEGTISRGDITADATSNTKAVYAFDTIKFNEQWLANVGVRYDHYTIKGDYTPRGKPTTSGNDSWNMFNYQLGLVYKPAPNGSIYVSYATASTPPSIAGGDQTSAGDFGQLDPEKSHSIELGTKWNVLDERLALTAALFQSERKNAQIEVEPGVFEQAGKARVKGLELGFAGNITPKWQVFGGYTFMKSKLVKGAYNGVNEGDPLANTPEHSFSLWSTYKVLPRLTVGGGAYYVGKTYGGNQGGAGGGANGVYMPAYWRFDAMAAYEVNDQLTMQLNVLNLTDKDYYTSTNGNHYVLYGPGRQAILSANLRF